jgi:hypothetical protein
MANVIGMTKPQRDLLSRVRAAGGCLTVETKDRRTALVLVARGLARFDPETNTLTVLHARGG